MNVSELLSYQPDKPDLKRRTAAGSDGLAGTGPSAVGKKKKLTVEGPLTSGRRVPASAAAPTSVAASTSAGPTSDSSVAKAVDAVEKTVNEVMEEKERLLHLIDEDAVAAGPSDENDFKRLLTQFEKRIIRNQELRVKHSDQPQKFMESEIELHQTIQELRAIASMPEMFGLLEKMGAIKRFIQMLSHENTDIATAMIELLNEMTDMEEADDDGAEQTDALIGSLLEDQVVQSIVQNLERFDEQVSDEFQAVHNALGVLENLFESRPDSCYAAASQGLLKWLLKRIQWKSIQQGRMIDANKLYASEILAILTQDDDQCRELLGSLGGIDYLLQQLAQFKRHNPKTPDDLEYLENLFNTLCSCLSLTENRSRFLKGEGIQLMNLMMREKKQGRYGAVRVLDHALSARDSAELCDKFVEVLGLRTIFPMFLRTPRPHKHSISMDDMEEHVVSVIAALVTRANQSNIRRVIGKFVENDFEKADRLAELHFKYANRLETVQRQVDQEKREYIEAMGSVTAAAEVELQLKRVEGGLFSLQLVDVIALQLCTLSPAGTATAADIDQCQQLHAHLSKLFKLHKSRLVDMIPILDEYAKSLDENSTEARRISDRLSLLSDECPIVLPADQAEPVEQGVQEPSAEPADSNGSANVEAVADDMEVDSDEEASAAAVANQAPPTDKPSTNESVTTHRHERHDTDRGDRRDHERRRESDRHDRRGDGRHDRHDSSRQVRDRRERHGDDRRERHADDHHQRHGDERQHSSQRHPAQRAHPRSRSRSPAATSSTSAVSKDQQRHAEAPSAGGDVAGRKRTRSRSRSSSSDSSSSGSSSSSSAAGSSSDEAGNRSEDESDKRRQPATKQKRHSDRDRRRHQDSKRHHQRKSDRDRRKKDDR